MDESPLISLKAGIIGLISLLAASPLHAQNLDAEPNYMFAAVLGSGFYRVEDVSLSVVRIPLSMTLREITDGRAGLQLLLPVTVGYASLDPEDVIDRWIPTELSTLSFIPGVEYRNPIGEHLLLKPFIQAGGGYDFNPLFPALRSGPTTAPGAAGESKLLAVVLQRKRPTEPLYPDFAYGP